MREIKFRAWDFNLEQMFVIDQMPDLVIGFDGHVYDKGVPFTSQIKSVTSNIKLMQFTGLKDENGTEVYDGDIFECDEHFYYVVEWQEDALSWFCEGEHLGDFLGADIIVIGNIHNNPELLNKKRATDK